MIEAGFLSYCRVDVLQEFFANSPDLAFSRVNKSARGFVLKVVFVVLECDKSLSFSHTFCSVGNVQISSDVFGFVVDSVDRVSVRFLVGRCNVVHDQLVVRSFVHFVVVGCFVGRYKCFRRIVDFPDVML